MMTNLLFSPLGLIVSILLWHLLYDWHWQGAFIAEWKSKHWFVMFIHSLTWATGIVFILMIFGDLWIKQIIYLRLVLWLAFLTLTHYCIDCWKCRYETKIENAWTLYVDQFLHLVTVAIILGLAFYY